MITLTFIAVARGNIVSELSQRRNPAAVLAFCVMLSVFIPVLLPVLLVMGILFQPVLHLYEIYDFCKTMPCLP